MLFSTPIKDFGPTFAINANDKVLALGSCFAQVVGQRMADRKLDIMLNPTGVLYNPKSIFLTLDTVLNIAEGKTTAVDEAKKPVFEAADGRWYSWMASSVISGEQRDECVKHMTETLRQMARQVEAMDVLMLTFGTDHYYCTNNDTGQELAVTNCHKMPSRLFEERVMSVEEIVCMFTQAMHRLQTLRPGLRTILSVSPYRYLKYGLHGSRLSKARLLLATDRVQESFDHMYYFPAYEILNDELRDYRFYAPDMVHPSQVAEDYIWQLFCQHYMDDNTRKLMTEQERLLKAQAHRPINH